MKKAFTCIVLSIIIAAGIFISVSQAKAETDPQISQKLDVILEQQKAILNDLEAMKQELYIIKIRVTQQQ